MISSQFSSDDADYTALCSAITLQSNKNGFFQQIVNSVALAVDSRWLSDFGTSKSNTERLEKCLNHEGVKDCVYQMMGNVQEIYRGKSAEISASRRLEAKHLFTNGKTERALLLYTQSIIKAPAPDVEKRGADGPCLALALWGRSEVLYHLDKLSFCLEDVKFALKEKLPDHLKPEAYWRMAECYIRLEQFKHARITLNVLAKMMSVNMDHRWTEKIQCRLRELQTLEAQPIQDAPKCELSGRITTVTSDRLVEPLLANASSKLHLSYSETAGRFFTAGEKIKTGETLVVEEPYVACLSHEKYGTHCQKCLRRLEIAIPCDRCSAVAFCSVGCRASALATFHKFECRYLDLLIGSGMSVLSFAALRIVSQRNFKYFLDADLDGGGRSGAENSYKKIYNMVTHDKTRTASDFLHRTLMALFLLAVLKKAGYFITSTKSVVDDIGAEEIAIANILLRNLEILQFNAHEILEAVKPKHSKSIKTVGIGVGLYLTASTFNHDCFPAVFRYFSGAQLTIKATRPVSKGDLVGDNYGPVFTRMSGEERRKKLRSRYWFECRCAACTEGWPKLDELDNTRLQIRCTSCSTSHKATQLVPHAECKQCGEAILSTEIDKRLMSLNEYLHTSFEQLQEELISKMCNKLDVLDESLCPPHRIYAEVADKLSQYWMSGQSVHIP